MALLQSPGGPTHTPRCPEDGPVRRGGCPGRPPSHPAKPERSPIPASDDALEATRTHGVAGAKVQSKIILAITQQEPIIKNKLYLNC